MLALYIFPCYLIKRTTFGKMLLNINLLFYFLYNFFLTNFSF